MTVGKVRYWTMGVAVGLAAAAALAQPAQAEDIFSSFFGFGRSRAPSIQMPFADTFQQAQPRARYGGGGQAFCVRTCDGRHFPISGADNQSKAASCNNLCPSAETKVVYGSNIDNAATENGKSYSELPNAFRYRNEIVEGCTCNGKDALGSRAGQHREGSDLAQRRHRRGRQRPRSRQPSATGAVTRWNSHRRRSASRRASGIRRWWRGNENKDARREPGILTKANGERVTRRGSCRGTA